MEDIPALPSFNPEPTDTAASRWDRWIKRFENYLVAKDITKDTRKCALLLHHGGEEVFEIKEALTTGEEKYEELKGKLTDYFAPKHNREYEVFMFRQASQQASETLDKFYTRLCQLAKNCEFHEVDREIKLQIIQKCQLSKVRDKGLSNPLLSLEDLLKYGRTLEATTLQVKAMSLGSSGEEPTVHKLEQPQRFKSREGDYKAGGWASHDRGVTTCSGCGGARHERRELSCPAWGKECFKCHRANHFARVCKSGKATPTPVRTHFV